MFHTFRRHMQLTSFNPLIYFNSLVVLALNLFRQNDVIRPNTSINVIVSSWFTAKIWTGLIEHEYESCLYQYFCHQALLLLFFTHCIQLYSSWQLYSQRFSCCTLRSTLGAFCHTLEPSGNYELWVFISMYIALVTLYLFLKEFTTSCEDI